ncbi:MAG: hypothetical protein Q6365_018455 [Candidatus Sigynarchaeota archaeon]
MMIEDNQAIIEREAIRKIKKMMRAYNQLHGFDVNYHLANR